MIEGYWWIQDRRYNKSLLLHSEIETFKEQSSMSRLPFIAELHDIGKLVDWDDPGLSGKIQPRQPRHALHDFDFAQINASPPTSPSWWGQWSDSLKDLHATGKLLPSITEDGKACVLLTNIADVLAASISQARAWRKKGAVEEGLHLLWNPTFYQHAKQKGGKWAAFRSPDELKAMFHFIDSCKEPQEFFERYGDPLLLTPEDKSAPLNFIPLRTHLDLTGKVFRVLRFHSRLVQKGGKTYIEYDGQEISQLQEAAGSRWDKGQKGKWVFRIVKCTVRFPQSMVRLQDLNVLELRRQAIEKVVSGQETSGAFERQPYAVLFHADNFFCLFLPKENHLPLRNALRPLWERGFWVECEELEAELNLLTSTGERTHKQLRQKYEGDPTCGRRYLKLRYTAVWPDLDQVIAPPICDLCQQRHAEEYLKEQVREWLCQSCREIREMGEPASIYARWEEEGFSAAWLKISLDQNLLLSCLHRLFEKYVDAGPGMDRVSDSEKEDMKKGFRPLAAQMEFIREYDEFLQDFGESLDNLEGSDGALLLKPGENLLFPSSGYPELAVVRLDRYEILKRILDVFVERLRARFPECLEDCPIRLSVSMGSPKYPYHEHWRFFSEPKQSGMALHIQQPGVRQVTVTVAQYTALRDKLAGEGLSHYLHRLAAIEGAGGELTALVQALEQRKRFPQIHELMMFHQLGFGQILDFYRLIGSNMLYEEVLHA